MIGRLLRVLLAAVVLLSVSITAAPAVAQTRGQIRRARVLFAHGLRQYDRGRFQAALRLFTRAYQLTRAPAVVFNMAECHAALGDDERAIESYRLFLQLSPDAPNRDVVDRKVRQLEAHRLAEQRRQQRQVAREVQAEQERIAADERREAVHAEESRGGGVGLATWITLGAGVVLAGVGALFHLDAVAQQDELDDPQLDCRRALGRCLDLVEAGDRSALLRTVLLPAGGAVLVTGVVMMIVDLGSDERPGDARLFPVVSPTLAGLALGGTW